MKLHWSPKSPFVRKVMIVAHELELVDRIALVRSVAAMNTVNPAIMADNPLNKIPTLVLEDGTILIDSILICEYLDLLAGGGRLFPATPGTRLDALARHALADGLLALLVLWRNERDKPSARQTPEWIEAFAAKTEATLNRMDRIAPTRPPSAFDIGDVAFGATLGYVDFRFPGLGWRENRAALTAWFNAFRTRPSAIATEVVDG